MLDRAINSQGRGMLEGIIQIEMTDEDSIRVSDRFRYGSLDEFCVEGAHLAVRMKALVHRETDPIQQDRQLSRDWYSGWNAISFLAPPRSDVELEAELRESFRGANLHGDGDWI
ncbi:MAG: hypothetical protein ACPHCI_01615 [Solirubrobacterales bacterium]